MCSSDLAEHLLAARAITPEVGRAIVDVVARYERSITYEGIDIRGAQPSRGNIEGGLTTLEEKSLGAAKKAGNAPFTGVLDYADVPSSLDLLGGQSIQLVDPFTKQNPITFQQDWPPRKRFKLDYIYLSHSLASTIIGQRGGVDDFPTAFTVSDHAPLHLTLKL